jgi:Leucine-rich repeat (LRR) protein
MILIVERKFFVFSRNQLAYIPPSLCKLSNLEILIINNNKLVSLPEEIGQLERLIELVIISLIPVFIILIS